ncbi:Pectinesterase, catalytic [Corchorus capsularis]|uniref:Pectinesterase n=1 Tax=Corchorus capsularis TaxID=210143 RepID=A0A1R3GNP0_COCAP|nr:Pectinesterase, catalytic [Corchorus capsularis]
MESFTSFLFFYLCFFFVFTYFICPAPPLSLAAESSFVGNATANCTTNSTRHGHHWIGPIGHRRITVDLNGLGHFRSVQDAVDAVPENNRKNILIQISPGYYIEKVVVPATKPYITFQGAGRDVTFIEWHDRACDRGANGQQLPPAPMPGMQGWQAVAFRISGDKAYFSGCGFYGAQDTLCDDAGRHYFKECYIEGSIDFIFGNGRSMYKNCELHSIATRFGSIAAHDRNSPDEKTGFAFVNCTVTGTGPLYVGRAMGQYSRIVYAYTYFDDLVAHGGWDDWDHVSNKNKTVFFGVYKCWGPGAAAVRGVSWARELDFDTAHPFLAKSFVNGRHWIAPWDA